MIKSVNLGLAFTVGYQTLFTVTPTSHNTARYLISLCQFGNIQIFIICAKFTKWLLATVLF